MPVKGAREKIHHAMMECENVTAGIHRFGGTEYKLNHREIGHIHGDHLVDIPFPKKIRDEIINKGEAQPHHVLPDSGWISIYLYDEKDVDRAIDLLRKSHELAIEQLKRRHQKAKDE